MRKKQSIKIASQKEDANLLELILEIMLDMREMIEKQNELIRRKTR